MAGTSALIVRRASTFARFFYNLQGWNKYGLLEDDLLNEEQDEEVKEAIRRLPQEVKDERDYRHIRALHASMLQVYLPKEEWTKIEDCKGPTVMLLRLKETIEEEGLVFDRRWRKTGEPGEKPLAAGREQDVHYLKPYLDEVRKENLEKAEWDNKP